MSSWNRNPRKQVAVLLGDLEACDGRRALAVEANDAARLAVKP